MGRAEYEDEQEELEGIAATLLCLAVLAEFLCLVPFRVRILVLSLLRPAEAVARAFAFEQTGGALALPAATVFGLDGDGSAEASRLALCFRILASIIAGLHGFAGRQGLFHGGPNASLAQSAPAIAWLANARQARRATAFRGPGCFDTS